MKLPKCQIDFGCTGYTDFLALQPSGRRNPIRLAFLSAKTIIDFEI